MLQREKLISCGRLLTRFCGIVAISFICSCVRYHKLIEPEFPQGEAANDNRDITHNFVRSTRLYDQFQTQAAFDVLWLSDNVRKAYAESYTKRRGIIGVERDEFVARQCELAESQISFYVLTDIRDPLYLSLSEKDSPWTLYVSTKNSSGEERIVRPNSIKEVEMEPEYRSFFKHRLNSAKQIFLVTCPAYDQDGVPYSGGDKNISLVISSPTRSCSLEWRGVDHKRASELLADEDFYWC